MKKKILLVENEANLFVMLEASLSFNDYEVVMAVDGENALEKIHAGGYDLVLVDAVLPKLSGYELVQKIRQSKSKINHVPIIVMLPKREMGLAFAAYNVASFIPKPVIPGKLMKQIETAIEDDFAGKAARRQPGGGAEKKKILLAGVQDFILNKIQEHLEAMGFEVIKAWDDFDAIQKALNENVELIFCQFWEDAEILDANAIQAHISELKTGRKIPFVLFCVPALQLDALKEVSKDRLLVYHESTDLIREIDKYLAGGKDVIA